MRHNSLRILHTTSETTRKLKQYQDYEELYLYALLPALGILLGCWLLSHTLWRRLP